LQEGIYGYIEKRDREDRELYGRFEEIGALQSLESSVSWTEYDSVDLFFEETSDTDNSTINVTKEPSPMKRPLSSVNEAINETPHL
uniref:Uncharacterized protein n=1 Tax=Amphimedon queenslandica TaxID=400682 RepID=A0A1X7T0J9_AMPQE